MSVSGTAQRIGSSEPRRLEFTAQVTAIRELARVDGRQVWQIALDKTSFSPDAAGQQTRDTGILIATARSGAQLKVPVTAVHEDQTGEVWHTTSKPLQEGTAVRGIVEAQPPHEH